VDEFVANIVRRGKGGSLSDVRAAFGRMPHPVQVGRTGDRATVLVRALLQLRGLPDDATANDAYAKAAIEKYGSAIRSAIATW
jgi:hypothetical protein